MSWWAINRLRKAKKAAAPSRRRKSLSLAFVAVLALVGCTERRQETLLRQAEDFVELGKYAEARDSFSHAIALNAESRTAVRAHYKLGFLLETYLRDYESAAFQYAEFLKLSRDPVSQYEVQKRMAGLYFDHHAEPERAIAAYRKLYDANPESLERDLFQLRIALGFFRKNDFEQARVEFERLLEIAPKSQYASRARFEIGNCYYMEGRYDLALEAFRHQLRQDSQTEYSMEAQFLVAQTLDQLGRTAEAERTFEALRGRYPSSAALETRLSDVRKRKKQQEH